jgi:hypothetical protein
LAEQDRGGWVGRRRELSQRCQYSVTCRRDVPGVVASERGGEGEAVAAWIERFQ